VVTQIGYQNERATITPIGKVGGPEPTGSAQDTSDAACDFEQDSAGRRSKKEEEKVHSPAAADSLETEGSDRRESIRFFIGGSGPS